MCTTAIYKLYYCILFFSLSKHKANTAELHPKVRQTCYFFLIIFLKVLLQTLADSYRIKERPNENSKKFFDTRESMKKNIQNVYSDDYYDPKIVSVIKKVLFVGIPSIFLLFSVIYWLVGLYNHYISSSVVH